MTAALTIVPDPADLPGPEVVERPVIGALLLAPDTIVDRVLAMVADDDFVDGPCRFVIGAIRRMRTRGMPVDVVLVAAFVESAGMLRSGAVRMPFLRGWLADAAAAAPVASSGTWYAGDVLEKSVRRSITAIGERLSALAGEASIEELAEAVASAAVEINTAVKRLEG